MKSQLVELNGNMEFSVLEDTQYVLVPRNSDVTEHTVTLSFEKQGVAAEIIGFFKLKDNDSISLTTIAHHKVPNTSGLTRIKGVLYDNTNSVYIGKIIIDKKAQQTSSFLEDATLVLGKNTKNRSDPILEIEADDVKASHGATTGRVDELQIYYLQSRGLTRSEAEKIIVSGFLASLISQISDPGIKSKVFSLME